MSRSKAVQYIFNIWTGNITPKPKHNENIVWKTKGNNASSDKK
jgi:hypothetical protein